MFILNGVNVHFMHESMDHEEKKAPRATSTWPPIRKAQHYQTYHDGRSFATMINETLTPNRNSKSAMSIMWFISSDNCLICGRDKELISPVGKRARAPCQRSKTMAPKRTADNCTYPAGLHTIHMWSLHVHIQRDDAQMLKQIMICPSWVMATSRCGMAARTHSECCSAK